MRRITTGLVWLSALMALAALGCERQESKVLKALQGAWETANVNGEVERVHFDVQTVTYGHGTDGAFTCPYRVNAYHEKESFVELRIKCKQRTGADAWIDYRIDFKPGREEFTFKQDQRGMGTFRRAS